MVETLAELSNRVGYSRHLIEDLLRNHVNDLHHRVKQHPVLLDQHLLLLIAVRLLLNLRYLRATDCARRTLASFPLKQNAVTAVHAFNAVAGAARERAPFVLRVALVHSQHVVPRQVVKIDLFQLLAEHVVDTHLSFGFSCQLLEPADQKRVLGHLLQAVGALDH